MQKNKLLITNGHNQVSQLIFAQERPGGVCSPACSFRTLCARFLCSPATAKHLEIIIIRLNRFNQSNSQMVRSNLNWNSNHFVRAAAKSLPSVLRARGRDQFDRVQQFGDVDTMMYWRGGILGSFTILRSPRPLTSPKKMNVQIYWIDRLHHH